MLFGDGFLTIQIIVIHGFNACYIFIDPKDAFRFIPVSTNTVSNDGKRLVSLHIIITGVKMTHYDVVGIVRQLEAKPRTVSMAFNVIGRKPNAGIGLFGFFTKRKFRIGTVCAKNC